jgi:hypothetical protein
MNTLAHHKYTTHDTPTLYHTVITNTKPKTITSQTHTNSSQGSQARI